MCQFCPEIVAYRVDADKNLILIYEEGWDEDGEGDVAAAADAIEARMAKILAEHRGRLPDGLSGGPPVA